MLKEKAGVIAGNIWNALNETEGMTAKQLKKATKLVDKDLFLGLGWLLREDKVSVEEVEGELFIKQVLSIDTTMEIRRNLLNHHSLEVLIITCNSSTIIIILFMPLITSLQVFPHYTSSYHIIPF